MIRVLIVSAIRLYREGLAQVLGHRARLIVVGVKSELHEAAADMQRLKPDVVLVDMAVTGSHAAVRDLKRLAPGLPVVALSVAELEEDILSCMEAGAGGYVTREGSVEDLVTTVESAARGELRCSPAIAGSLQRRVATLAAAHEPWPAPTRLTIREREIASLIEQGLSNKQIAVRLGIEVATVKNHVHNLLEKLNVHRRSEAARLFNLAAARLRGVTNQPVKR